jgi:hypothetical protein
LNSLAFAAKPEINRNGSRSGSPDYLDWLATWIGVRLRPDRGASWNFELLRLAARILPWRGTQKGVEAMLNAYLRHEATAAITTDSSISFQVQLTLSDGADANRLKEIATEVLNREKPAHTTFQLLQDTVAGI